jgi:hypothetical protein
MKVGDQIFVSFVSVATSKACCFRCLPSTRDFASIAASGAQTGWSFVAEIMAGVQGTALKIFGTFVSTG